MKQHLSSHTSILSTTFVNIRKKSDELWVEKMRPQKKVYVVQSSSALSSLFFLFGRPSNAHRTPTALSQNLTPKDFADLARTLLKKESGEDPDDFLLGQIFRALDLEKDDKVTAVELSVAAHYDLDKMNEMCGTELEGSVQKQQKLVVSILGTHNDFEGDDIDSKRTRYSTELQFDKCPTTQELEEHYDSTTKWTSSYLGVFNDRGKGGKWSAYEKSKFRVNLMVHEGRETSAGGFAFVAVPLNAPTGKHFVSWVPLKSSASEIFDLEESTAVDQMLYQPEIKNEHADDANTTNDKKRNGSVHTNDRLRTITEATDHAAPLSELEGKSQSLGKSGDTKGTRWLRIRCVYLDFQEVNSLMLHRTSALQRVSYMGEYIANMKHFSAKLLEGIREMLDCEAASNQKMIDEKNEETLKYRERESRSNQEIAKLRDEILQLRNKAEHHEREHANVKTEKDARVQDVETLREMVERNEEELGSMSMQIRRLEEKVERRDRDLSKVQREKDGHEKEAIHFRERAELKEEEFAAMEIRMKCLEGKLEERERELSKIQDERDAYEKERSLLKDKVQRNDEELAEMEDQFARLSKKLQNRDCDFSNLQVEHSRLKVEHDARASDHSNLHLEHTTLRDQYVALQDRHDDMKVKHDAQAEEHYRLNNAHSMLREEHDRIRRKHDSLQRDLSTSRNEHLTLQDEHVRMKAKHDSLLAGRSKIRDEHSSLQDVHSELHDKHTSLEDENSTLRKEHAKLRKEHAALRNDYVRMKTKHEILSAERSKLQDEHSSLQTAHSKLRSECSEMETKHDLLSAERSKLQDEHSTLRDEHASLGDEHRRMKAKHDSLSTARSNIQHEHSSLHEVHSKLRDEHSTLRDEHSTLRDEYSKLRDDHDQMKSRHALVSATQSKILEKHSSLQDDRDRIQRRYDLLRVEQSEIQDEHARQCDANAKLREEHTKLRDEHYRLHGEHNHLKTGHDERTKEHSKLRDENAMLRDRHSNIHDNHKKLQEKHTALADMVNEHVDHIAKLKGKLSIMEENAELLNRDHSKLRGESVSWKEKFEIQERKLERLKEKFGTQEGELECLKEKSRLDRGSLMEKLRIQEEELRNLRKEKARLETNLPHARAREALERMREFYDRSTLDAAEKLKQSTELLRDFVVSLEPNRTIHHDENINTARETETRLLLLESPSEAPAIDPSDDDKSKLHDVKVADVASQANLCDADAIKKAPADIATPRKGNDAAAIAAPSKTNTPIAQSSKISNVAVDINLSPRPREVPETPWKVTGSDAKCEEEKNLCDDDVLVRGRKTFVVSAEQSYHLWRVYCNYNIPSCDSNGLSMSSRVFLRVLNDCDMFSGAIDIGERRFDRAEALQIFLRNTSKERPLSLNFFEFVKALRFLARSSSGSFENSEQFGRFLSRYVFEYACAVDTPPIVTRIPKGPFRADHDRIKAAISTELISLLRFFCNSEDTLDIEGWLRFIGDFGFDRIVPRNALLWIFFSVAFDRNSLQVSSSKRQIRYSLGVSKFWDAFLACATTLAYFDNGTRKYDAKCLHAMEALVGRICRVLRWCKTRERQQFGTGGHSERGARTKVRIYRKSLYRAGRGFLKRASSCGLAS
eukprot:g2211.t1